MVVSRQDIIDAARECLKTPYIVKGRIPGIGLDCAGVILWPGNKLNLFNFDYRKYGNQPNPELMYELLTTYGTEINKKDVLPGDVIWFKFTNDPQHLAIYTGENIIHAVSHPRGEVVEHSYRYPWPKRAVAAFRYPGIE